MTTKDIVKQDRSVRVKALAAEAGFDFCGISKAEFLEEEAPRLENWLNKNHQGAMGYMANHLTNAWTRPNWWKEQRVLYLFC